MCDNDNDLLNTLKAAVIVIILYCCIMSYVEDPLILTASPSCLNEDLCKIKAATTRYVCNPRCNCRYPVSETVCKDLERSPGLGHDSKVAIMEMLKKVERAECYCTAVKLYDLANCDHGGEVVSTLDTVVYANPKIFSASLDVPSISGIMAEAKNILTSTLKVGHSWGFSSRKPGRVVIRLMSPTIITGFAIHHPENYSLPYGYKLSAPKNFSVLGHENNMTNFSFGEYHYCIEGRSTQVFAIKQFSTVKYEFIEFQFHSNHGNPLYTTVYGVSVYGFTGFPWFQNRSDSFVHLAKTDLGKALNFH